MVPGPLPRTAAWLWWSCQYRASWGSSSRYKINDQLDQNQILPPRPVWLGSCLPSSPSQPTGQRPFSSVRTPSYPWGMDPSTFSAGLEIWGEETVQPIILSLHLVNGYIISSVCLDSGQLVICDSPLNANKALNWILIVWLGHVFFCPTYTFDLLLISKASNTIFCIVC